ncbi:MAG: hypothetical protein WD872_18690 [Pirellulaceae bacterium]
MAKKSSGPNKSVAIRTYKAENGDAGPKAISEGLAKQGLKVTAGFVSTVLSNDKRRAGKPSRKAKRGGRRAATGGNNSLASLLQAKKLVDQMGSVDAARAALDTLAKLLD